MYVRSFVVFLQVLRVGLLFFSLWSLCFLDWVISIVLSSRSLIFFFCFLHSATESKLNGVFYFGYCIVWSVYFVSFFFLLYFPFLCETFYFFVSSVIINAYRNNCIMIALNFCWIIVTSTIVMLMLASVDSLFLSKFRFSLFLIQWLILDFILNILLLLIWNLYVI